MSLLAVELNDAGLLLVRTGDDGAPVLAGEESPGLAVLLMSGYVEDDFVRHGVVPDEVAFLHKPFSLDELARAVRKVLDEARVPGGPGRS